MGPVLLSRLLQLPATGMMRPVLDLAVATQFVARQQAKGVLQTDLLKLLAGWGVELADEQAGCIEGVDMVIQVACIAEKLGQEVYQLDSEG